MVDMASKRGSKCNSPSKRPRDGPRSFSRDDADVSGSGTIGATPFSLSAEEPAAKRGHTVAHAGGHRVGFWFRVRLVEVTNSYGSFCHGSFVFIFYSH